MCHSCDLQSLALQKSSPMSQALRYALCSSSSISSSMAWMRWVQVSFGPGGVGVVVGVVVATVGVGVVVTLVVWPVVAVSWAVVVVWLELFRFTFFGQRLAMWPC